MLTAAKCSIKPAAPFTLQFNASNNKKKAMLEFDVRGAVFLIQTSQQLTLILFCFYKEAQFDP
jgi:hypothetical protein